MEKMYFSTVVSSKYIYKLIVMYKTLIYHCNHFHLFIFCSDDISYHILTSMDLKNTTCFSMNQIEDQELLRVKGTRPELEYAWTLKSVMLFYIMTHYQDAKYYAHIDADLCFFSDPGIMFLESPDATLYLTDHNNSEKFMKYYDLSGRYNTGFVGCRNCPEALEAIAWWRHKCIECCTSIMDVERELYGDQKYVEAWPQLFPNVYAFTSRGINVALWNVEQYHISHQENRVFIDNDLLIFYHFSGFSILGPREFNLSWFHQIKNPQLIEYIYIPYMHLLISTMEEVKQIMPNFREGFTKRAAALEKHYFKIG